MTPSSVNVFRNSMHRAVPFEELKALIPDLKKDQGAAAPETDAGK